MCGRFRSIHRRPRFVRAPNFCGRLCVNQCGLPSLCSAPNASDAFECGVAASCGHCCHCYRALLSCTTGTPSRTAVTTAPWSPTRPRCAVCPLNSSLEGTHCPVWHASVPRVTTSTWSSAAAQSVNQLWKRRHQRVLPNAVALVSQALCCVFGAVDCALGQDNADSDSLGDVCDPCPADSATPAANSVCPGVRTALLALHTAAGGANWNVSTNWGTDDPCGNKWFGVQCDTSGSIPKVT